MSLIHQALTRPLPPRQSASRFNPLHRVKQRHLNLRWWGIATLALLLTAVMIWAPWQSASTHALPMVMQPEPEASSLTGSARVPQPMDSSASTTPLPPVEETRVVTPAVAPEVPSQPSSPSNRADPVTQPSQTSASTTEQTSRNRPVSPNPETPPQPQATPELRVQPDSAADTRIRFETQHQDRVQQALSRNDAAAAELALRRWITEQPEAAQPRLWLAKLLLSQHRLDAIGALLEGHSSVEARALLALWHEKAQRPAQAATLFEQLARDQPQHSAWQLHWAINAENSGQLALAQLLYQTYLDRFAADNPSLTAFADQRIRSLERP